PGPYMLFLVDTNGVPSTAAMVRVPAAGEDNQPPSPPTNLAAATGVGSARLTWSAATDNVAVTGYTIYRSTTSGFTPTTPNKIGTSTAISFNDTTFTTAGTYYYLVTAQDAAGNTSQPSNQATAIVQLDTTAPTVSLTAPVQNATVAGVTQVTASATDNVGV